MKKIAFIGARGIANYGGFETFVYEVAPRLAKKGFKIFCTCEKTGDGSINKFQDVDLIYFPIKPPNNYLFRKLFEIVYDMYFIFICSIKYDIIYELGLGGGFSLFIPKLFGKKSFVNIDGVEWTRSKFSFFERFLLIILFRFSCYFSYRIIIDNSQLKNYIPQFLRNKSIFIPYGINEINLNNYNFKKNLEILNNNIADFQLNNYWLVVARLEPENNIKMIIEGYIKSNSSKPLIVVGSFTNKKFQKEITDMNIKMESKKINFLGSIYDQELLNLLRQNCFGYFHGHSVGGTNPSLLEAMIMKNIIIAHDNIFNREVCNDSALFFESSTVLSDIMNKIEKGVFDLKEFKDKSYLRAEEFYSWENVTLKYDEIFNE